jgi:hypothetical protein
VFNRSTASGELAMDERQKLRDDLERYRTLRDLITDEPTIEVIEMMIKETEDRLAEIERRPSNTYGPHSTREL